MKSKIIIGFCIILMILSLIVHLYSPLILKVSAEAELGGVKNNSYAIIDKLTFYFRNPQQGELVEFRCSTGLCFSKVSSTTSDGIYIRGDNWEQNVPSVFVSKNDIRGKIIPLFTSVPVFSTLFYISPFIFTLSLFYVIQNLEHQSFRWQYYLKGILWFGLFYIVLILPFYIAPDIYVHLFIPNYLEFYKNPSRWYFAAQDTSYILGFVTSAVLAGWRFAKYLQKDKTITNTK